MTRTETVTVVFTDLVGSTELANRLGHDAYEALRHKHFAALRSAVAKHGGTEVKTTGDGLMVRFDSAASAVACAVAMQQATDREAQIRIGVSAGEATHESGDLFGAPVVEAARLCAAAGGGQIVVSEIVRLMARGRGHSFASLGELNLKGIAERVPAHEVQWEPLASEELPLPPRLTTTQTLAMIGRAAESAALAAAWAKAKDGQRQLVLIAGEPGIGKTRLATEAALGAHADGAVVLLGTCDEDASLPYQPFVEALRHYVTHAPEEVLRAHVQEHRGELGRLIPELGRRVADLPPPQVAEAETERYMLFDAVTGLLSAASQHTPLVLVLDDLHWARAPELLLLKHMVRSMMPLRLLVLGTYRDSDLTRAHPLTSLLADLRREAGVERLALHGLDEAGVVALMTAAAGHDLTEPGLVLARAIYKETEGSPLFVGEILRNLTESGAIFQENDRWTYRGDVAALGIPEGIKEAIRRRLGRLPEATNKVLSLAAVIGRQFDVRLLAAIAEGGEDAVLDALEEATRAALVAEVPGEANRFGFSHALIRATLYEELGAARRARLHRKVGEALEALADIAPDTRIDELAYHWLAATQVADAAKAIGYARQAGDRALAGLAFEEAAAYYERALGVLQPRGRDDELLRCDLLIATAEARRRAGNPQYRETVSAAVELARRLGDAERLAMAALASARSGGWMANANVVDEALVALYEEASTALGAADSLLRARMLGQLATELVYTPNRERRHALSREAIDIARRRGDRSGLAQVMPLCLFATNDPFTLAERLALTAELAALAEELGSSELAWNAALHRAGALLESADIYGAERCVAEMERLAAQLRQPFYTWLAAYGRATLATTRGAADAEAQALAAFEIGSASGQPDAGMVLAVQLGHIRRHYGRGDEIIDRLRAVVEAAPHIPAWSAAFAYSCCETDRVAEARAVFAAMRERGLELSVTVEWVASMYFLGEVCAYLQDAEAAAVLYPQLLPVADQVGTVVILVQCYASLHFPAALLASCLRRWEEAERHFEAALATNERLEARPWVVRTRRGWAAMLLDRDAPGDRERAAELIAAGRAEAEQLGMAREIVRFDRLRERMGE